jgi:hypothetical protein
MPYADLVAFVLTLPLIALALIAFPSPFLGPNSTFAVLLSLFLIQHFASPDSPSWTTFSRFSRRYPYPHSKQNVVRVLRPDLQCAVVIDSPRCAKKSKQLIWERRLTTENQYNRLAAYRRQISWLSKATLPTQSGIKVYLRASGCLQ